MLQLVHRPGPVLGLVLGPDHHPDRLHRLHGPRRPGPDLDRGPDRPWQAWRA
jgi:hypothetical protein